MGDVADDAERAAERAYERDEAFRAQVRAECQCHCSWSNVARCNIVPVDGEDEDEDGTYDMKCTVCDAKFVVEY